MSLVAIELPHGMGLLNRVIEARLGHDISADHDWGFLPGDVMHDVYTHGLVMGDFMNNIAIDDALHAYKEHQRTNKDAIMTMVLKPGGGWKGINIPPEVLAAYSDIDIRNDPLDCSIGCVLLRGALLPLWVYAAADYCFPGALSAPGQFRLPQPPARLRAWYHARKPLHRQGQPSRARQVRVKTAASLGTTMPQNAVRSARLVVQFPINPTADQLLTCPPAP